ncbi:MAG: N-acetylmuramoyl-L-alanine amidase [Candidatus Omnitrophica bacterium]|nr:N-acetylmuramoyl-L-alanine amidase [Candidatus Omnitrophota bacterium]
MHSKTTVKILLSFCLLSAFCYFLSGCATVPTSDVPSYSINGATYFPLIRLCEKKGVSWEYDNISKIINLKRASHKINLRVGDSLMLVDSQSIYLNHPVDIYQGAVVVPYRVKEQMDSLFRESRPGYTLYLQNIRKIVIDAGHGGNDPGAIGRTGLREKDVNLDIAKRLTKLLKEDGVEVVFTRSTDRFIPLSSRVNIANSSQADLFVSIHSNASRVRTLNGFEVYYVAPSVSDSKRAVLAAKDASLNLNSACFGSHSSNLKAILWDMIYTSSRAESIELSKFVCRSMNDNLGVKILGVKSARFEVLRGIRMPGVLIETGFVSNFQEERKLKNGYYRQQIAEAIEQGINGYAKEYAALEAR